MVGQGVSCTETADRIRTRNQRNRFDCGAQLVGNWTEVLSPVVAAEFAENEWPETMVLDATWFMVTNRRTGDRTRAFSLLAVDGYPAGQEKGRCGALRVTTTRDKDQWAAILRGLPGEPKMGICDGDQAIKNPVGQVWSGTFIKRCEHHLRKGVMKQMEPYGQTAYGSPGWGYSTRFSTARRAGAPSRKKLVGSG